MNCKFEQIAREVIAETKTTDEAEDEIYGDERGDELPEELRTPEGRREFFRRAARRSAPERGDERSERVDEREPAAGEEVPLELDAERIVARDRGRRGGCGRAGASSSSIAGSTRIRSRARGMSGFGWRPSGWRSIWMLSAALTRLMRGIGRRGG